MRPTPLVHREIEGTRRIVGSRRVPGASIPWNDWRADTTCGQLVDTLHTTRKESAITCPRCINRNSDSGPPVYQHDELPDV